MKVSSLTSASSVYVHGVVFAYLVVDSFLVTLPYSALSAYPAMAPTLPTWLWHPLCFPGCGAHSAYLAVKSFRLPGYGTHSAYLALEPTLPTLL